MRALAVVVATLAAATAARAGAEPPFYAAAAVGAWHGIVASDGKRYTIPGDRFGLLALSPDRASYAAPVGTKALWIGSLKGGGRKIATAARTAGPVYTPDGRVAYAAGATIRPVGGATLRPKLPVGGRIVELAAARDAFAVSVETGNGKAGTLKVALYLVQGSSTTRLAWGFDAYSNRPHPVFSPDGHMIAFEKAGDIWVTDRAGEAMQISRTKVAAETDAAWSPDSARIAYTSGRHGVNEVYVATLDGRERRLTHTAPKRGGVPQTGSRMGAWSPDGTTIAFTSYNSLATVPATGGATRVVRTFTPAGSTYLGPLWW